MDETEESPGWHAIDRALEPLYPGVEPHHWGTLIKWVMGGPDPLDGISAYPRTDPVPHWHYISYGMSELYDKDPEGDPDISGWGFEFTFRLVRDPSETTPPVWAANLLQNLGRYVFTSGNWFEPGHHMDVNGPIAASRQDSAIRAIVFDEDPELGTISTPHGRVRFLQVIGLATEEYEAARAWNTMGLLEVLAPKIPLYVTDIDRTSLLSDPELAAAVQAGIERDGSSSGVLFVTTAQWERQDGATTLKLGALQAPAIRRSLRGRLPFGRALALQGQDGNLFFEPADTFSVRPGEGGLTIGVPDAALDSLIDAIRSEAGRVPVPALPGLTVEIIPTRLRDAYGRETGEVVG